jgi:hypothetical protein
VEKDKTRLSTLTTAVENQVTILSRAQTQILDTKNRLENLGSPAEKDGTRLLTLIIAAVNQLTIQAHTRKQAPIAQNRLENLDLYSRVRRNPSYHSDDEDSDSRDRQNPSSHPHNRSGESTYHTNPRPKTTAHRPEQPRDFGSYGKERQSSTYHSDDDDCHGTERRKPSYPSHNRKGESTYYATQSPKTSPRRPEPRREPRSYDRERRSTYSSHDRSGESSNHRSSRKNTNPRHKEPPREPVGNQQTGYSEGYLEGYSEKAEPDLGYEKVDDTSYTPNAAPTFNFPLPQYNSSSSGVLLKKCDVEDQQPLRKCDLVDAQEQEKLDSSGANAPYTPYTVGYVGYGRST